jgi:uncharacterized membrane protein YhaH (DUF805 family)
MLPPLSSDLSVFSNLARGDHEVDLLFDLSRTPTRLMTKLSGTLAAGIGLFSGIFGLLSLIPAIIVHIKRFHDRDKSGWWVLMCLSRSSARCGY